ncbi:TPA: quorum-sensing system DWW-type pheromone, partial [Streptococcus equi subsp. equi]|nr:quorum-sensing system DWW-type pheromone [Streptococcus equi subsp. equi]HEK9418838.1 quorum-sensing system DWW-type pheromone [Streptococcus equi subsp. equi]HEL0587633.1 quorum-sensing system DWW-type pheromone [Streptococcus equi subsp. zooepidemicus]
YMFKKYQYYLFLAALFLLHSAQLLSDIDWWRVG